MKSRLNDLSGDSGSIEQFANAFKKNEAQCRNELEAYKKLRDSNPDCKAELIKQGMNPARVVLLEEIASGKRDFDVSDFMRLLLPEDN